ncbi:olfactory receptor 14A16-like [Passer domesticus]|uniref:olfactory receptor 14A16-like n=1 Tax=Passer domesticus TaxID=48849 RepID=UPI0030FEAA78
MSPPQRWLCRRRAGSGSGGSRQLRGEGSGGEQGAEKTAAVLEETVETGGGGKTSLLYSSGGDMKKGSLGPPLIPPIGKAESPPLGSAAGSLQISLQLESQESQEMRPRSSSRSKEENCEHAGLHGQPQQMSNSSPIRHFLLLALADMQQLQLLHFCLLLGISLAALLGNGLIISAVACGHHLHTPMFFFLLNLALSDLGSICTTVPKAMHNSLWDTSTISQRMCCTDLFLSVLYHSRAVTPDHHVLQPLRVHLQTPALRDPPGQQSLCPHGSSCLDLWLSQCSHAHSQYIFLPLGHGNALSQFFCEVPQILRLSCSHSNTHREVGLIAISSCLVFGCFVFIVFSYVQIFRIMLRIPSEEGKQKAFSPASLTWLWSPCLSALAYLFI